MRSPEPFWLIKNGLLHAYPSLQEDAECEVLVIGGGITGALILDAFATAGFDTVLVDKRDIATGSTAATTAMLQYEIDTPLCDLQEMIGAEPANACYLACRDAIYALESIVQSRGIDCGFKRKHSLYFAHDARAAKWLAPECDARAAAGLEVAWMAPESVLREFGIRSHGAILSQDGASIDAYACAKHLVKYHQDRGARVYDKTEISNVEDKTTGVTATTATGHVVNARHVIYCTGYETKEAQQQRIVDLFSTYACVSEEMPTFPPRWSDTLIWNTDNPYLYMRTTDDNRILIGGVDKPFKNARVRDAIIGKMEQRLTQQFSEYCIAEPFAIDYVWAGTFGATKDGLPYIGRDPEHENRYYALGFGGNGILFSVIAAGMLPRQIRGEIGELDQCFRFGR